MKTRITTLLATLCLVLFLPAQTDVNLEDYLDRNPIYDYDASILSNTATIPDYDSKEQKIQITGTIFLSDGVTPAKDVILYIEQPNEFGDFDLRYDDKEKRYVHHRVWVKTDADGKYTINTFIPGNDRRYKRLQQLFPTVKAPDQDEVQITTFLFDDDPFLTKGCRKRIAKRSNTSRILVPKKVDDLLVAQRDIILEREEVVK
ncbi:MAG: hypothetical protein HRU26_03220 [Psychroserpens sp.]|nr:hypothetical protein [Psychroserpens sp.]